MPILSSQLFVKKKASPDVTLLCSAKFCSDCASAIAAQECEGFMAKGIAGSGAGFDAASVGKLGGRGPVPVHNPPAHQMKSQALKVWCTLFFCGSAAADP